MAESEKSARELNDELLYCCYAVFRAPAAAARRTARELTAEAEALLEQALAKDVYTRGTYDISGYRADADLMIWWTCPDPDVLQETYGRFRSTALGPPARAGLVGLRAAPAGRIQPQPHPRLRAARGPAAVRLRLPVRALAGVVRAA